MDLVIRNARHDRTGQIVECGIQDGVIAAVAPGGVARGSRDRRCRGDDLSALIDRISTWKTPCCGTRSTSRGLCRKRSGFMAG